MTNMWSKCFLMKTMKTMEITIDVLESWLAEVEVLFASCSKKRKKLYMIPGAFVVEHKDDRVYVGNNPEKALKIYNEI